MPTDGFCKDHPECMRVMGGIEEHLKTSSQVRGIVLGMMITVLISIFTGVYSYGLLNKQVEINTSKWDKLEALLYKIEVHERKTSQ